MKTIVARTLLGSSIEQLWQTLNGQFNLKFDDGKIVQTNARETIYSAYAWVFHQMYPDTPLLPDHHVKTVLKGSRLGSDTHLELLGACMWTTYETYKSRADITEVQLRDTLSELVYRTTNKMYNDLSYRLEEYVTSLDIIDFVAATEHPEIKKANDEVQATQKSIDDTYGIIRKVLMTDHSMDNNPLALAARSKIGNIGQINQCIGPRGFLTDTDSNVFRVPITRGFVHGIRSFHDSLIESRSAAKSLIFSKSPLQQAEYFSRRLQLMSQTVKNLHAGDCGTPGYIQWHVRGPKYENGVQTAPGDLKQLEGKYYIQNNGTLKAIRATDKDLIGKNLKIRSVTKCAHPDPYGVCATCFGEMSLSVPAGTNIGQMCCTSLASKSSQNVLSVKHQDGSSVVDDIVLTADSKNFLAVSSDGNSYLLAPGIKDKNVFLIIEAEKAANITDVMEVKNIGDLNITRISELSEVGIMVGGQIISIDVNLGRRLASMTYPLLEHIRKVGWGVDERGNYTIDMKDWDYSQTILTLPLKHINMSDHSKDIADLLESSVDQMQARDKLVSPNAMLIELFDLVNDKLTVNLAVLDVVLYSVMIVSAEDGNYSLPKPWTNSGLGVMKMTMANRSLSAAMAYEGHKEILTSPSSFTSVNRTAHPMDMLLMPAEVIAAGD